MSKIPKVLVGYLPPSSVAVKGTSCDTCRDFIEQGSLCRILRDPIVNGPHGTCIFYLLGEPYEQATPLQLISKEAAGYIEGKEVPTCCGRCGAFEHPGAIYSTCEGIGDSEDDLVAAGGCCNAYHLREKSK